MKLPLLWGLPKPLSRKGTRRLDPQSPYPTPPPHTGAQGGWSSPLAPHALTDPSASFSDRAMGSGPPQAEGVRAVRTTFPAFAQGSPRPAAEECSPRPGPRRRPELCAPPPAAAARGPCRSPDGHPALGVVQPLQAAEEVRQRVRGVAGQESHQHRGSLQGRLGENPRLLFVILRVRLGGKARPAAAAEQSPGEEQQRAGEGGGGARSHVQGWGGRREDPPRAPSRAARGRPRRAARGRPRMRLAGRGTRARRLGPLQPGTLPPPLHRPGPDAGPHRVPAAASARPGSGSQAVGAVGLFVLRPAESSSSPG